MTALSGVNLRIALDFHHTSNEFAPEPMFKDPLGPSGAIFSLLLAIYSRDLPLFTWLFEDQFLSGALPLEDQDLLRLLRVCLKAEWHQGFLKIVQSVKTTERVFCNSSYDFKEDYI